MISIQALHKLVSFRSTNTKFLFLAWVPASPGLTGGLENIERLVSRALTTHFAHTHHLYQRHPHILRDLKMQWQGPGDLEVDGNNYLW